MKNGKKILLNVVTGLIISWLFILLLNTRMMVIDISNTNDDYDRNIWGDMTVSQDIEVSGTSFISIKVKPECTDECVEGQGFIISVTDNDIVLEERIQLSDLEIGKWNEITIKSPKLLKMRGIVKLELKSLGMDESNYIVLHVSRNLEQAAYISNLSIENETINDAVIPVKFNYCNYIVLFLVVVFSFVFSYVSLLVVRKMRAINCKERFGFICYIILAFVAAFIAASVTNPVDIVRGGEEKVQQITDDNLIAQSIHLSNTNNLHVNIFYDENDNILVQDAKILFTLEQGGDVQLVKYDVCELENGWNLLDLNYEFSEFVDGDAVFSVKGEGIPGGTSVAVLLTSGEQRIDLNNVMVGESTVEGKYLWMSYGFFDWYSFLYFLILTLFLAQIFYLVIPYLKKIYMNYPTPFIAVVVILIEYIKCEQWTRKLNPWITTPFVLNYKNGFISKALLGEIISWFTEYVTENMLQILFHVMFIALTLACISVMGYWLKTAASNEERDALNIMFIFYIASPFFLTFYLDNWGRNDIVILIFFVITVLLLIYSKSEVGLLLITVLSVSAILTHQIYIFVLYPAVFLLFLYKMFVMHDKKVVAPAIVNMVIPAMVGFYVQFIGKIDVPLEAYLSYLRNRTDTEVLGTMVSAEYYMSFEDNVYSFGVLDSKFWLRPISIFISMVLLIPLLKVIYLYWKQCIELQKEKMGKVFTFIAAFIPLTSIPMFMTISDYGRILTLLVCEELFMILALWKIDYDVFAKAGIILCERTTQKYGKMNIAIIVMYLMILGICNVGGALGEIVPVIAKWILNIQKSFL